MAYLNTLPMSVQLCTTSIPQDTATDQLELGPSENNTPKSPPTDAISQDLLSSETPETNPLADQAYAGVGDGSTTDKASSTEQGSSSSTQATTTTLPSSFTLTTNQSTLSLPSIFLGLAVGVLISFFAMLIYQKHPLRNTKKGSDAVSNSKSISPSSPDNSSSTLVEHEVFTEKLRIGKVHNIGARPNQQDSFGFSLVPNGALAIVADGMGGLSDGDKVSQTIVKTILGDSSKIGQSNAPQKLYPLAAHANHAILNMLGPSKIYKCGSTLITVLIQSNNLQWLSIGDSRIYLFRTGMLLQLNREHTLEHDMLLNVANGKCSMAEVYQSGKLKGLTSFIGMGELKHVDASPRPIRLTHGDRVLLMSDGVYNSVSESELENILSNTKDVNQAAAAIEQSVLEKKKSNQDNFTLLIIDV